MNHCRLIEVLNKTTKVIEWLTNFERWNQGSIVFLVLNFFAHVLICIGVESYALQRICSLLEQQLGDRHFLIGRQSWIRQTIRQRCHWRLFSFKLAVRISTVLVDQLTGQVLLNVSMPILKIVLSVLTLTISAAWALSHKDLFGSALNLSNNLTASLLFLRSASLSGDLLSPARWLDWAQCHRKQITYTCHTRRMFWDLNCLSCIDSVVFQADLTFRFPNSLPLILRIVGSTRETVQNHVKILATWICGSSWDLEPNFGVG